MSQTYLTTDQLAERIHYDARTIRTRLGRAENVQFLRALIRERLDHPSSVRCHVTRVKHGPARFA